MARLNTPRSNFLSALEHFWNSYGSKQSNLILVICGSAASWMIQKIIKSRGGLHNRLTRQIRLMPFTLQETELFLKSRGVILTRYQTILLYMAMGGVPFYLTQAETGLSAAQIIGRTCFSRNGILRNEFDNLFASLFDHIDQHIRIVEVLRQNLSGMKRNQLLSLVKIPSGGSASKLLEELEESGVSGTQIDLLIDRRDAAINLCEIKFSESEFEIDAAYENNLRKKVEIFRRITKTRKNIFITLITTFGISNNSHASDIVTNSLTMDCLF